jgi:hypothetical protein
MFAMFSTYAISEFADKYSDHLVLASATGAGGVVSGVLHVIPYELATLLTVALFLTLRICVERWWHRHHARKAHRLHLRRHPAKRRTSV